MPKEIWVAIIVAGMSLIVAVFSTVATFRTQKRLSTLNDRLQEQRAERDARRDYEYESKKRLYGECEPVLFQALELAETARRRVISLARTARNRDLSPDGSGWLADPGYYFRSTVFYLLAPATSYKILQRRLTAFDLTLDPNLQFQYELLKLVFSSYTFDHDLSKENPSLRYNPDEADPENPGRERLLQESPQVHRRQGLYLGIVDQIADALVTKTDDVYRCKSLGEFWLEFDDQKSKLGRLSGEITELFRGFHPLLTPVLWRVLVAQYLLFGALLQPRHLQMRGKNNLLLILPKPDTSDTEALDWRTSARQASDSAVAAPLLAAHSYLLGHLDGSRRSTRSAAVR
jgi:hypothetical protein